MSLLTLMVVVAAFNAVMAEALKEEGLPEANYQSDAKDPNTAVSDMEAVENKSPDEALKSVLSNYFTTTLDNEEWTSGRDTKTEVDETSRKNNKYMFLPTAKPAATADSEDHQGRRKIRIKIRKNPHGRSGADPGETSFAQEQKQANLRKVHTKQRRRPEPRSVREFPTDDGMYEVTLKTKYGVNKETNPMKGTVKLQRRRQTRKNNKQLLRARQDGNENDVGNEKAHVKAPIRKLKLRKKDEAKAGNSEKLDDGSNGDPSITSQTLEPYRNRAIIEKMLSFADFQPEPDRTKETSSPLMAMKRSGTGNYLPKTSMYDQSEFFGDFEKELDSGLEPQATLDRTDTGDRGPMTNYYSTPYGRRVDDEDQNSVDGQSSPTPSSFTYKKNIERTSRIARKAHKPILVSAEPLPEVKQLSYRRKKLVRQGTEATIMPYNYYPAESSTHKPVVKELPPWRSPIVPYVPDSKYHNTPPPPRQPLDVDVKYLGYDEPVRKGYRPPRKFQLPAIDAEKTVWGEARGNNVVKSLPSRKALNRYPLPASNKVFSKGFESSKGAQAFPRDPTTELRRGLGEYYKTEDQSGGSFGPTSFGSGISITPTSQNDLSIFAREEPDENYYVSFGGRFPSLPPPPAMVEMTKDMSFTPLDMAAGSNVSFRSRELNFDELFGNDISYDPGNSRDPTTGLLRNENIRDRYSAKRHADFGPEYSESAYGGVNEEPIQRNAEKYQEEQKSFYPVKSNSGYGINAPRDDFGRTSQQSFE